MVQRSKLGSQNSRYRPNASSCFRCGSISTLLVVKRSQPLTEWEAINPRPPQSSTIVAASHIEKLSTSPTFPFAIKVTSPSDLSPHEYECKLPSFDSFVGGTASLGVVGKGLGVVGKGLEVVGDGLESLRNSRRSCRRPWLYWVFNEEPRKGCRRTRMVVNATIVSNYVLDHPSEEHKTHGLRAGQEGAKKAIGFVEAFVLIGKCGGRAQRKTPGGSATSL
ncbi:hypothetical protein RHGRI_004908 [Rhododendron griersonianum]|uniref:Uncharacterized protein n=1 Tax=Rhododendron griersonianum TaxID=479676 RepID=A0AAV6LAN1_9ERIC|nr:hypothetical protein RHGRI_004908 [Rhododendron griersonianum]